MRVSDLYPIVERRACQWRRQSGPLGLLMFSENVRANWPAEMSLFTI